MPRPGHSSHGADPDRQRYRDIAPRSSRVAFQQGTAGAERLSGQTASVNLDAVHIDTDYDDVGVCEARRKPWVHAAGPECAHFHDVVDDRRTAAEGDPAVAGEVLIGERDGGRGAHLRDLA